jgi:hypothetical protein
MSHDALSKLAKSHSNEPNVWFVGVTPRRNPELVVAVLWQNGGFSYYPARIGAKVVSAYVEKQRRLANNLLPPKARVPVEVGAVWSEPGAVLAGGKNGRNGNLDGMKAGRFFVDAGEIVSANKTTPGATPKPASVGNTSPAKSNAASGETIGNRPIRPAPPEIPATPSQLGAALPAQPWKRP